MSLQIGQQIIEDTKVEVTSTSTSTMTSTVASSSSRMDVLSIGCTFILTMCAAWRIVWKRYEMIGDRDRCCCRALLYKRCKICCVSTSTGVAFSSHFTARLCTRTIRLHYTMKRQTIAQLKSLRLKCIQLDNRWLYCLHPTPLDSWFHPIERSWWLLFSAHPAARHFHIQRKLVQIIWNWILLHTEEQYSFQLTR